MSTFKLVRTSPPQKPEFRTKMSPIPKSIPWLRYPLAVVVAFAASIATVITFTTVEVVAHITSDSSSVLSVVLPTIFNLLVGLAGVSSGARCLKRAERTLGSLVLVALGIGFEVLMLGWAHGKFLFPRGAIGSGIGGLLVVGFYLYDSRSKS